MPRQHGQMKEASSIPAAEVATSARLRDQHWSQIEAFWVLLFLFHLDPHLLQNYLCSCDEPRYQSSPLSQSLINCSYECQPPFHAPPKYKALSVTLYIKNKDHHHQVNKQIIPSSSPETKKPGTVRIWRLWCEICD
jgi:hypothetical protein